MRNSKDDKLIDFITKAMKISAFLIFAGVNIFLVYNYVTAYQRGKKQGEAYFKNNQNKKNNKKQIIPEQNQPQYIEKQMRKYRAIVKQAKREGLQ